MAILIHKYIVKHENILSEPNGVKFLDYFELYHLGNQIWYICRGFSSAHRQATQRKIVLGI